MHIRVRVAVSSSALQSVLLLVHAALTFVVVTLAAVHLGSKAGVNFVKTADWQQATLCMAQRLQHQDDSQAGATAEDDSGARLMPNARLLARCLSSQAASSSAFGRIGAMVVAATAETLNATIVPPKHMQEALVRPFDDGSSLNATASNTEQDDEPLVVTGQLPLLNSVTIMSSVMLCAFLVRALYFEDAAPSSWLAQHG